MEKYALRQKYPQICINLYIYINTNNTHQLYNFASIINMMHNRSMRTTITLEDETHEFAAYYARARGLTLSAAIDELIRKAQAPAKPEPKTEIIFSPDGFPMFPPAGNGRVITEEMVRKLEEEEFDPKKFT